MSEIFESHPNPILRDTCTVRSIQTVQVHITGPYALQFEIQTLILLGLSRPKRRIACVPGVGSGFAFLFWIFVRVWLLVGGSRGTTLNLLWLCCSQRYEKLARQLSVERLGSERICRSAGNRLPVGMYGVCMRLSERCLVTWKPGTQPPL